MSAVTHAVESSRRLVAPVRLTLLQRKCACGGSAGPGGMCEQCRQKRLSLQRRATGSLPPSTAPPDVNEVLRSPGQSLDTGVRHLMESRFGHAFDHVRIHADARASRAADAVQALAFTVGHHIVFGAGQLAPTSAGQRLLAHELTHVVQQAGATGSAGWQTGETAEREAESNAERIGSHHPALVHVQHPAGAIQRQGSKLDDTAKGIIARAKGDTDIAVRGPEVVTQIISTYYPSKASLVSAVVFDDKKAKKGLKTATQGTGASVTGKIYVGHVFIDQIDHFARRVLQVGHELEHVEQHRAGLAGPASSDKREFLAFFDEAMATEMPGTGRMSFATRLTLIDAALGYLYCLTADEQKGYADKKDTLLKRRGEVNGKAGNPPTDPPTECKRQDD